MGRFSVFHKSEIIPVFLLVSEPWFPELGIHFCVEDMVFVMFIAGMTESFVVCLFWDIISKFG